MQLSLEGFNHQNALLGLGIYDIRQRQMEDVNFEIKFDGSVGVEAWFQCEDVEVVAVQPCNSEGQLV